MRGLQALGEFVREEGLLTMDQTYEDYGGNPSDLPAALDWIAGLDPERPRRWPTTHKRLTAVWADDEEPGVL
jgi:hypothetical protein